MALHDKHEKQYLHLTRGKNGVRARRLGVVLVVFLSHARMSLGRRNDASAQFFAALADIEQETLSVLKCSFWGSLQRELHTMSRS